MGAEITLMGLQNALEETAESMRDALGDFTKRTGMQVVQLEFGYRSPEGGGDPFVELYLPPLSVRVE